MVDRMTEVDSKVVEMCIIVSIKLQCLDKGLRNLLVALHTIVLESLYADQTQTI